MPTLKFRCLDMFGVSAGHHRCCPYYKDKFMKVVFQFLELYSGGGRRMPDIEMLCCFVGQVSREFSYWLRSIYRLGVERLHLSFDCCASYPIRDSSKLLKFYVTEASSLKHLFLSGCIVLSSPKIRLNSLVTLALRGVVLPSGQLEDILFSCSNLKELTIVNSKLPYKLRLTSAVTVVVILACDGWEQIDIHAPYLHTLECMIYNNVRFFFSFAPMLENLIICPWGSASHFCLWRNASNSYIFGASAKDLPDQVKSLTVNLSPHEVINYFPTEIMIFRNLRKLSLTLVANNHKSFDMVKLYPLLGASPLLQYLSLMVGKNWTGKDERGSRRPPLSPTCFTELKQVTFGGFYGTESDMEFVLYILRSAIVLERMFLTPRYIRYFDLAQRNFFYASLDETKRNSIQQKLHGQAISRKAAVIIQ